MTIETLLKKTNLFLLDMDGTLYIDDIPIGAVRETLARLRVAGKRLVYCTNNSSKTPEEYRAKLKRIGLWGEGDFVYTSGIAAAEYLKKHHAGKSVYLVGRDALKEDFASRGIRLTEEKPDVCVLAYDTALTFEKRIPRRGQLLRGHSPRRRLSCSALPQTRRGLFYQIAGGFVGTASRRDMRQAAYDYGRGVERPARH